MEYRKFGKTDLTVSAIGFGAWAIGGNAMVGETPIGWGVTNDEESVAAIKMALDKGVNFFDTADFYGLGHSEKLLGEVLFKEKEVILATKVGHRNLDNTIQLDYSKDYILKACENSLRRLQRDTIDYYQLHTAKLVHFNQEECISAMEQLVQQGKIRYWGLSLNTFYPEPEANYMLQNHLGDGFQLVFNIINQRAKQVIEKAAQQEYGIIARMPLQFGLLTGKFTRDATFRADDHRSFRFSKEILEQSLQILEDKIWPLCNQYNCSKTVLANSFILSNAAISTVIPGIRTVQQVVENTTDPIILAEKDIQIITKSFTEGFSAIVALMEKQG